MTKKLRMLNIFTRHPKKNNIPAVPTFKQNLQACRFVDAGKQLITREDRLFELKQDGIGSKMKLVEEEEDSEARLAKDYEDWMESVTRMLENSLDLQSLEEQELLKGAVQAILQEEEQDLRWKGFQEKERPPWRPRKCKQNHEALLERLVQRRMEEAQSDSSVEIHSSLQQTIICNAKRLKEDLLKVVTWVSSCYPEQENVCQFYATLYHKTFSARLREVAEYTLCDKDCVLLLQWVNQDYPNILNSGKIKDVIDHTKLDPLLPEDMIAPLEQQFLITKETELSTCLHKILDREETAWKEGELPQLRDQVYCCDQAIDIIECFHKHVVCAQHMLGKEAKAQRIICQMRHFLTDYKTFHDKVMRSRQTNTEAILMVNLSCLIQCRDYITKNAHLFPEDIKTDCLSLLATMTESSHCYFTSNMHRELKDLYRKVGSSEWLKHSEGVCEELLAKLDRHIQKFINWDKMCCQELLGGMHKEFLAEYVRKMMKQKIKLSNKAQQQMAASSLCINSECIHTYFIAAGSDLDWLKDILPNLAGLLKLQDPDSIKLELVTLIKLYPDLSERHISAWLRLKGNLSPSDLKMILKSVTCSQNQFSEKQDSLQFSRSFFSTVRIR
ncbi:tumor necrosis factor alpha-induced protein 2-like [Sinocyclocheilus anshuiensis]|uniref:tumor necrosis factor alpha-induced protein 2-like n=1 Tax=Sinocyclocheilus anshuiensis TaxID=1608454 RepID=UPI0007B7AE02|nr:PREDICTED: tumor necrosis factor alpha-induced protein 2-like [Sinocyclocheilus anshuiensis]